MKKIYYATGNKGKAGEAERMLGIDLEVADLELDELQSMDLGVIVRHKVEQAYEKLKAPVIVDDVSVEVEVWNGFPGPFIKFAHHAGGIPLLLYFLRNETNRNIKVICTLGYHDGEKVHVFSGVVPGIFTTEERGEKGWGLDPIILPDGQTQTFSEMDIALKNRVSHRALAFEKLKKHLEGQKEDSKL